jgi:hypothetical protein
VRGRHDEGGLLNAGRMVLRRKAPGPGGCRVGASGKLGPVILMAAGRSRPPGSGARRDGVKQSDRF